jgi:catechol 2,3-dioxygenase-like lactoylglutathione lyase family enzyme
MTAGSIAHVVPILPVKNLARAMDFYRRLGFSAHSWRDGDGYGFLTRDGLEIHLSKSDKLIENQNPCGVYFYLVDGTAAALEAEFLAAGVSLSERLAAREWKQNEFALRDPDGNLLVFGEGFLRPEHAATFSIARQRF